MHLLDKVTKIFITPQSNFQFTNKRKTLKGKSYTVNNCLQLRLGAEINGSDKGQRRGAETGGSDRGQRLGVKPQMQLCLLSSLDKIIKEFDLEVVEFIECIMRLAGGLGRGC